MTVRDRLPTEPADERAACCAERVRRILHRADVARRNSIPGERVARLQQHAGTSRATACAESRHVRKQTAANVKRCKHCAPQSYSKSYRMAVSPARRWIGGVYSLPFVPTMFDPRFDSFYTCCHGPHPSSLRRQMAACRTQRARRLPGTLYWPTWLDHAHKKLDAAVFAAYGWPVDLSNDETLCVARLLALNLERAGKQ